MTTVAVAAAIVAGTALGSASPASAADAAATHWSTRIAGGTVQAVRSAGSTWSSAGTTVRGGRSVRTAAAPQAPAILRHARVGTTTWTVRVPRAGRYRITLLLRTTAAAPASVDLVTTTGTTRVRAVRGLAAVASVAAASVSVVTAAAHGAVHVTVRQVGAAVPAVSGVTVTALASTPASPAPTSAPAPASLDLPAPTPGLTWASGVYPAGTADTAAADRFAAFRGSPVAVADVFHTRDNWEKIADERYSEAVYSDFPGRLAIALPLLPGNLDASMLPRVAAGDYDQYFTSFAAGLQAEGRGNSIIRLAWEFNGNWYSWAAFDPTVFKAAFRRVVGDLRKAAPGLLIDWNGNVGVSQVGHDPFTELYPGDDVVDIVGLDVYDNQYNHVTDNASWQSLLTQPGGLDQWLDFAQQHGKKFSVPEWGLDNQGPGDNPFFVQKMHDFFAANASSLAFECYFSEGASYIQSNLDAGQNPKAAALYKALF